MTHVMFPDGCPSAKRTTRMQGFAAAIVLFAMSTSAHRAGAIPSEPTLRTANYERPFEPPRRPAYIPLPPGAVEPRGWLRDWCLTARDGYTGHMDEVHEDFSKAWAADYRMKGDDLAFWWKGAWPYEGGGYWFDGLVRLAFALHDESLLDLARSRLDVVVERTKGKGIAFLWWLDRNDPGDMDAAGRPAGGEAQEWPMWANGLLGRALSAYHAGSGDERVLEAMQAAYGGSPESISKGFALSNPWPAFETYTWTGNKAIGAALTELFSKHPIEDPPSATRKTRRLYDSWYNQRPDPTLPWYRQPDHGVHFNESTIPWALGYLWTGKREFLEAPSLWYEIPEKGDEGMQPHGVPVFDENSGPTGSFRGSETCNVSGYIWSQITLLRVGGQGISADRVERAFFNAAPAVVSRDFKTHVYLQSPNRIREDLPAGGQFQYQRNHSPLCCTASLNRFLPLYVTHLWMATYDNGLAATHYGPCRVTALVADRVPVELVCRTDYPFRDLIEVDVDPARESRFPLSFRIPGWCPRPEIAVNGDPIAVKTDPKGFVRIDRVWAKGDAIRLRFPMEVRIRTGHDNDGKDTPYAAVHLGPLLFALPIRDTIDANTPDSAARWNFALDVSSSPKASIRVEQRPMPERWDWPLESPLRLHVPARSFEWKPETRRGLPTEPVARDEASPFQPEKVVTQLPEGPVATDSPIEEIVLVPYGSTKFRVSMFPITERAEKALEARTTVPPRRN